MTVQDQLDKPTRQADADVGSCLSSEKQQVCESLLLIACHLSYQSIGV